MLGLLKKKKSDRGNLLLTPGHGWISSKRGKEYQGIPLSSCNRGDTICDFDVLLTANPSDHHSELRVATIASVLPCILLRGNNALRSLNVYTMSPAYAGKGFETLKIKKKPPCTGQLRILFN